MIRAFPCEWCPTVATMQIDWKGAPEDHRQTVWACTEHGRQWESALRVTGITDMVTRMFT